VHLLHYHQNTNTDLAYRSHAPFKLVLISLKINLQYFGPAIFHIQDLHVSHEAMFIRMSAAIN